MFLIINKYHNYNKRKYINSPQIQQYYYISIIKNNTTYILWNTSKSCMINYHWLDVYKATPYLSFKEENIFRFVCFFGCIAHC